MNEGTPMDGLLPRKSIYQWMMTGGTYILGNPKKSWKSKLRLKFLGQICSSMVTENPTNQFIIYQRIWRWIVTIDRSCSIFTESQYIMISWYSPSFDTICPFSLAIGPNPMESEERWLIIPSFGSLFLNICFQDKYAWQMFAEDTWYLVPPTHVCRLKLLLLLFYTNKTV